MIIIVYLIFRLKLLNVPDFAKDVQIGQKPKRGRKKGRTKALFHQSGEQEVSFNEEDEFGDEIDDEIFEATQVPSIPFNEDDQRAHLYGDQENDNFEIPYPIVHNNNNNDKSMHASVLRNLTQQNN